MSELCRNGVFFCALEAALGFGAGFILTMIVLSFMGFFDE